MNGCRLDFPRVFLFSSASFSLSFSASFSSFTQLPSLDNISRAVNAMGAASDLAIALVLVVLLHRARTGFSKSETIINRLIVFSINTGMLTSTFAVLSLITVRVFFLSSSYLSFNTQYHIDNPKHIATEQDSILTCPP